MTLSHRLTGYNKRTEMLELAFELPAEAETEARIIAHVGQSDPDGVGVYSLTSTEARRIAELIGQQANVDRYDWFFEPVAVPLSRAYA